MSNNVERDRRGNRDPFFFLLNLINISLGTELLNVDCKLIVRQQLRDGENRFDNLWKERNSKNYEIGIPSTMINLTFNSISWNRLSVLHIKLLKNEYFL